MSTKTATGRPNALAVHPGWDTAVRHVEAVFRSACLGDFCFELRVLCLGEHLATVGISYNPIILDIGVD